MNGHILVIGAMLVDTKGKPLRGLEPGTSNAADIKIVRGGTARNVAENLGALGANVALISAVGDDIEGRRLLAQTAMTGVNLEHVCIAPNAHTGAYMAILNEDGTLAVALNDTEVMDAITPDYLMRNRRLVRDALMVFLDGSLSEHVLETVFFLAEQYRVPVSADPSSTRLAYKLRPYLNRLLLVAPNQSEAAALTGLPEPHDHDSSLRCAQALHKLGVGVAVVTLSDFGFVYAAQHEHGYLPARYSAIVDSTGTGDAITAAIVFGMLEQLPLVECMRLGAAAAGITLQSDETVAPNLTLDLLYENLSV